MATRLAAMRRNNTSNVDRLLLLYAEPPRHVEDDVNRWRRSN
jgi:hypothetical protein